MNKKKRFSEIKTHEEVERPTQIPADVVEELQWIEAVE